MSLALLPFLTAAQERLPVIDMHLHAYPVLAPSSDPVLQAVPEISGLELPVDPEEHYHATIHGMDCHMGIGPDDPRLEPSDKLAQERRLPIGIYSSGGPPGAPYYHDHLFRMSLGDPVLMEPVLVRYPDLQVYLLL